MPANPFTPRLRTAIFLFVWIFSALYLAMNLNYSWVPHDEGILGHSADRILHGEVPHRDFDEPYTGGLGYLDAAALERLLAQKPNRSRDPASSHFPGISAPPEQFDRYLAIGYFF